MATVSKFDLGTIGTFFESIADARHTRNRKHLLVDVIIISICGMISHGDGPTAIHRWAQSKRDWLEQFLPLPNGIPSRDCIRRVLMMLEPAAFQECFAAWVASWFDGDPKHRHIAIDGKTCRGSHDRKRDLSPLHVVSAWASEHGIALGQEAVDDKSNEITAIPALLDRIDVKGATVTIDAMGCQKEIVGKIAKKGGNFVVAVKKNQPKLFAAIEAFFEPHVEENFAELECRRVETIETGHGRTDERAYYLANVPDDFAPKKEWPQVKAIGYTVRLTTNAATGAETVEVRYYIVGRSMSGASFAEAVRGQWSIESMHWVMDVNYREDEKQTCERTLVNNLSWLRRFAITLVKRHPAKDSLRGKMQSAGWNTSFLAEVLQAATV